MNDSSTNSENKNTSRLGANPLGYEKIPGLLTRFAIPSVIAMLVSSLYNVVDQIFIGQAVGTLGRVLVDGVDEVKLFGEPIEVRANIQVLAGLSGHADKDGLIKWVSAFNRIPDRVFIVHGEDTVCTQFANTLHDEYGHSAYAPYSGTIFDLLNDEFVYEAEPVMVQPKAQPSRRVTEVFARLLAAGNRLLAVIARNEGGANKDLAKFADQINSLCDKWDR